MVGFDWFIVVVLLASTLVGFIRGFIEEALSLTGWIVAFWLGRTYFIEAGALIHQYLSIPAPLFRAAAGFGLIFLLSLITFGLLNWLIVKIFVPGRANIGDRFLGGGFGAIRGAVIIAAFLIFFKGFAMDKSDWWQNSIFISKFEPLTKIVEEMIPDDFGLLPEEPAASEDSASDQQDSI